MQLLLCVRSTSKPPRDRPAAVLNRFAGPFPLGHGAEHNSKGIATPPTLSLTSSSFLGTFSTSGPSSALNFTYSAYGSSTATWWVYTRVDSESWGSLGTIYYGSWIVTLSPGFFYGSRVSVGTHTIQLGALDSYGVESNIISVLYGIEADGLSAGAIAGIVIGVIIFFAIVFIVAVYCFRRSQRNATQGEAGTSTAPVGGVELGGGDAAKGVIAAYPPPFQPTGAVPPPYPAVDGYPPPGAYPPPYPQGAYPPQYQPSGAPSAYPAYPGYPAYPPQEAPSPYGMPS
jgi:hypothetical protein